MLFSKTFYTFAIIFELYLGFENLFLSFSNLREQLSLAAALVL